MKKISLNEVQAGMVTAAEITTKSGQHILDKGVTLNSQSIMRLTFYKIDSIEVEDFSIPGEAEASEPAPEPEAPRKTGGSTPEAAAYSLKVKSSKQFQSFQIDHSLVLAMLKNNFEEYVNQGVPPKSDEILAKVNELFHSCRTTLDLFDMLNNMRSYDDSVYAHSLNVALICRRLGKWLKLDNDALDLLTLCGIYHDIGKMKVPDDILNKPGKYTDEEFGIVKMHTQYGYDLLKDLPLDDHIKQAALCHHERSDGSGYPSGKSLKEIDNCAMIVAIADVYDAMTAARSYRAPLCPFQVIANFEKDGLQKYHPKYILTFLSRIAGTYQNNRILLSDGRSAKIVMLNQNSLSRPIIQFDDGSCLDMSTQSELHIQAVV